MVALKEGPRSSRRPTLPTGQAGRQTLQIAEIAPQRLRRDALPENTHYADTGCDIHPSCLSCPLVRCRYDDPGGARRIFSEERDRAIVELSRGGRLTIDRIARRFGVSRRTVFRVLARTRGESREPQTDKQVLEVAPAPACHTGRSEGSRWTPVRLLDEQRPAIAPGAARLEKGASAR